MAYIFANYSYNQNDLDLNRLYANAWDVGFFDDANLTYYGVSYRDIYSVDWYLNGDYASIFGGDRITVDQQLNVTGGTISGYLELFWNGAEYLVSGGMQDMAISAKALFGAAATSSRVDDHALLEQALWGDDEFELSGGDDIAFGYGGNDWMFGFAGHDVLSGGTGDDVLVGGSGNDTINGGPGQDTAAFSGTAGSYTLTLNVAAHPVIADRRTGGDGVDSIIDVEFLSFEREEGLFALSQFNATPQLLGKEFESFIELYIAYFNRAPDAVGLNFWGTAFASGTTFPEIAKLFMDQEETRAIYPNTSSNVDFATSVYHNVLGRVPDQSGLDFWVAVLDSGEQGRDQFILSVLGGVQEGSLDRQYLDNKVDVGAYYAVHKGMSDVGDAAAVMALFDGSQSSIDRAVAAIDADYADAHNPTSGEFLMPIIGVLDNPFA
ncbi:MAG TPA: hypothetical protein DC031_11690 [Sulfitobacter sp.]|nr:hypothetical protein [Sulfitobacter sp.]